MQFCGNVDRRTRTSEFTNNQNRPYVGSEAHGRLVKAAGDRDWKRPKRFPSSIPIIDIRDVDFPR